MQRACVSTLPMRSGALLRELARSFLCIWAVIHASMGAIQDLAKAMGCA